MGNDFAMWVTFFDVGRPYLNAVLIGFGGTSLVHNLTAPTSSGTWAIFIRWEVSPTCNTSNYDGFGTVIANVIVP